MNSIDCGKFISDLRKEKKLTQNELADLLQVTNKAVSRWETGEGFPDVVLLPRLSEILNVTVDELLQGSRDDPKTGIQSIHHRFVMKNTVFATTMMLMGGYILFLALCYTTYQIWIGILGFVVPAIAASIWYVIARNHYLEVCTYDEEDRIQLFRSLRLFVTLTLTLLAMVMDMLVLIILFADSAFHMMVTLDVYIPLAMIVGSTFAVMTLQWFSLYGKKQNMTSMVSAEPTPLIITTIAIFLLFAFSSGLIAIEFFSDSIYIAVLWVIGIALYRMWKKKDQWYHFAIRVLFALTIASIGITDDMTDLFYSMNPSLPNPYSSYFAFSTILEVFAFFGLILLIRGWIVKKVDSWTKLGFMMVGLTMALVMSMVPITYADDSLRLAFLLSLAYPIESFLIHIYPHKVTTIKS
ncbi:MAG: helix-turn-helix transcriptional regulator [Candidatus Izemoplasmatales bacterium]|nr:helix-turn-helix transcriptional regulator [Candidatus Izemoplasmatales bacterium]